MTADSDSDQLTLSPAATDGLAPALSRRHTLTALGTVLTGALAGCTSVIDGNGTPTEQSYPHLEQTQVYLDDTVELSLPNAVPTVTEPDAAGLIILPGQTDAEADTVVDWLANDRVIALVGEGAENTWISWVQSDAYGETFDTAGYGRSNPKPDLLIAAAIVSNVTRFNKTWGNGPDDIDIIRKLDETLADIDALTPHN